MTAAAPVREPERLTADATGPDSGGLGRSRLQGVAPRVVMEPGHSAITLDARITYRLAPHPDTRPAAGSTTAGLLGAVLRPLRAARVRQGSREWIAIGPTEVACVREMTRCLWELREGRWPR